MSRRNFYNLLFICIFQVFSITAIAQMTAPIDPGGEPSGSDPPLGGGAPVGGGTIVMLVMAAVYGGKKAFDLRKNDE